MSGDVLILNSDCSPLSIIPLSTVSWQEAIKLLVLQKVVAVENYSDWQVHSQRTTIQVPSVVITKRFYQTYNRIRFTRNNLLIRDQFRCQYCDKQFSSKDLTVDHVWPKSMGGKRTWENSVMACVDCNQERGDDTSIQPIKKPHKPTYYELVRARKNFPVDMSHPSWQVFLNWDEHLVRYNKTHRSEFTLDHVEEFTN